MARLRDALELEWENLATRPEAIRVLRSWGVLEPVLAGFVSPAAVIENAHHPVSARAANDLLGALLRLGRECPLARRCLLQALVPALVALSGRHPSAGETPDDRLQTVLGLAVERIHNLAGEDIAWPAVAVVGHIRDRLRRAERAGRAERILDCVPLEEAIHLPAGPERTAAERLAGVVVDELRRGALRRDDAALIYTTRVAGHRPSVAAAACGLDPGSARSKLHRAERRLAASLSVC